MAADKCKENGGSLIGEDLEIFRTEYVDKEIERIYPNLSPHLPRKQKLHLNVFNGEDLEIAIDKATQWQKEQMIKGAVDGYLARDKETNCLWFFTKKPDRDNKNHQWRGMAHSWLGADMCSEQKWEDEPLNVKLIIAKYNG